MARAIDDALDALVPPHPNEDPTARQKLALAIAHGVIKHLDDNEGALHGQCPRRHYRVRHQQARHRGRGVSPDGPDLLRLPVPLDGRGRTAETD